MKKSQEHLLRQKTGDLNSVCGFKDYVFNDGPSRGMRAFDLYNGRGTELTVLADRGLDIPYLKFKGHTVSFNSKTGLKSPYLYTEEGTRGFLRQFYAGMLTTCGLTYAGGAGKEGDQNLGLHGPYSNLLSQEICARKTCEGDDVVIQLSGQVRQSQVFDENMVLSREFRLETERDILRIEDTVQNQGFVKTPLMLVYHINFGYPLLDEGTKVYSNAATVTPRDKTAQEGMDRYHVMDAPQAERPEECFFHTGHPREGFAMVHNEALGIAAIIHFDPAVFPLLCEWKCMRMGDYALGLEPTTSGVMGRAAAREDGSLLFLEPGEQRRFAISLEFTDDQSTINQYFSRSREKDFNLS